MIKGFDSPPESDSLSGFEAVSARPRYLLTFPLAVSGTASTCLNATGTL
jgi:hypothetical protein